MNRKYYKDLFTLLEASAIDSERNQEIIANNGMDTVENPVQQPEEIPEEQQVNPEENIEDANYLMNGDDQMAQQPAGGSAILDVEKKERLFDLFKNLLSYGDLFYNSLKEVDTCLIDDTKAQKLEDEKKNCLDLVDKIKTYILDSFRVNSYERSLYIYILLRTELLSVIGNIRQTLEIV